MKFRYTMAFEFDGTLIDIKVDVVSIRHGFLVFFVSSMVSSLLSYLVSLMFLRL